MHNTIKAYLPVEYSVLINILHTEHECLDLNVHNGFIKVMKLRGHTYNGHNCDGSTT